MNALLDRGHGSEHWTDYRLPTRNQTRKHSEHSQSSEEDKPSAPQNAVLFSFKPYPSNSFSDRRFGQLQSKVALLLRLLKLLVKYIFARRSGTIDMHRATDSIADRCQRTPSPYFDFSCGALSHLASVKSGRTDVLSLTSLSLPSIPATCVFAICSTALI